MHAIHLCLFSKQADTHATGLVHIGKVDEVYKLAVELKIRVPGYSQDEVKQLLDAADHLCPYSQVRPLIHAVCKCMTFEPSCSLPKAFKYFTQVGKGGIQNLGTCNASRKGSMLGFSWHADHCV